MQSEALRGDVQQKDALGIWRTILTASGHTLRDYRRVSADERLAGQFAAYQRGIYVPYVPGKTGAQYSPFRMPYGGS